ncbi:unnamed protein product [Parnassius mnemosyne]|uniref:PiggyBac transposable element-derived protein domain-containing protein n=1 Tax=Parnassius mnemosyne TaxID=213953 RepID=A0AAV1LKU4_9NEOP
MSIFDNTCDFELSLTDIQAIDELEKRFTQRDSPLLDIPYSSELCDDTEDILPRNRNRKRCYVIDSDDEDEYTGQQVSSVNTRIDKDFWREPTGKQRKVIPFTECPGLKPYSLRSLMVHSKPEDFYALLVPDSMFHNIAIETNRYAAQTITNLNSKKQIKPGSRLLSWTDTNQDEMKRFFGLILFMGIVRLPKLADYWSTDQMICQTFPRKIMPRNRFEILLRMVHFCNNNNQRCGDRLFKIRDLIDALNLNFKAHYYPQENLCIDESLVPFRGRIMFRQYIKLKRHKYGIKVFKLCTNSGYINKIQIYAGKRCETENTTPTNVVMSLMEGYLQKGHTLYTDNWYTSVNLGRKLLENETHLVGTLRKNRKYLPKDVINGKIRKGEFRAKENEDGITCMKWKDKRDVYLLSTKHSIGFTRTYKRDKEIIKPKIVKDYNSAKSAVDLSDQMIAYSTPLRKTVKWYRKLAVELLLNTAYSILT